VAKRTAKARIINPKFYMRKFFIIIFAVLFSLQAVAEDKAIAKFFTQHGVNGTMVIASLQSGKQYIHNNIRAKQRFSPASTFKIFNTLIALEKKAIEKETVLKWDGHIYDIPDWNHDQTLASAFKVSCVWCFQKLARQVGAEKYRDYLHKANYGTLREPFETTTFWLDGSLEVSAIEQINFLKKVYQRTLPFSSLSYDTLKQIMLVEQTPSFTIRAKTGWAGQIAWYVGYVETSTDVWFFATNLDIRNKNDLPLRQRLTQVVLQAKGIVN
jgi:beta-lactamase class D